MGPRPLSGLVLAELRSLSQPQMSIMNARDFLLRVAMPFGSRTVHARLGLLTILERGGDDGPIPLVQPSPPFLEERRDTPMQR